MTFLLGIAIFMLGACIGALATVMVIAGKREDETYGGKD